MTNIQLVRELNPVHPGYSRTEWANRVHDNVRSDCFYGNGY